LLYLIGLNGFDRQKFAADLENFLPFACFEDNIFDEVKGWTELKPTPRDIKADPSLFRIYCSIFKLSDLHSVFMQEEFQNLIYDFDMRKQIDGMSLSHVFRPIEIMREFSSINQIVLGVYLDCFANFKEIKNKERYINLHVCDESDQKRFLKILQTTSRNTLRVLLGLRINAPTPMEIIEKAYGIVNSKTDDAFISDNDVALEKWLKMQLAVADKMHNMGAGNQSDLDRLVAVLNAKPTFEDPIIYTKDMLDIE
jgi:hypothetical protein